MTHITVFLLAWNLVVWVVYGIDKLLAIKGARRISEATLLAFALCMGATGALFGMVNWNHKTAKIKFRILVPLFVLCNGALIWAGFHWIGL